MITDHFIRNLRRIVGNTQVSVNRAGTELYSYDASLARGQPGVVVFPADTGEAAEIVRAANQAGVAFVPRGFGTNLSGGTVLPSGGLVICMSRFNRILGVYPPGRYAVVQPGVTNLELQNALAPLGFFYAPDPASQKVATLGGNVGENSGGPRCLKYGVTTNHVLGLELILPDGEITRIGGPALDPPGYDLRGAVIGSEGTLGVVTEVTVRILPSPAAIITMLAIYDDIGDAARSVSDIIAEGMVPTTLEMMDAPIIRAVEDSYACGYPRDAAAVLIIEVEGPHAGLREQARKIDGICMRNGCRSIREAKDNAERNRLWEGRRGAFGAVARLAPNYLVNDCTVPRTKLPQALATVAEITKKYGFEHGNVFHAGDGNLHPLIFFDSRDKDQLKRVKKAGWEIMQACVDLGGTISGEHGIGLEKMDAMRLVFTEDDFDAQRCLKRAFDPTNRLNPGKVIPAPIGAADGDSTWAAPPGSSPAASNAVPTAEKELLENIREALSARQPISPRGCGVNPDFGNPTDPRTLPLGSHGLNAVIEYDPANQVATVGAGMRLKALQTELSANGQWLPLRPTLSLQQHSIGGLIALAACGPERTMYGAPRDLLLGLRFISGNGRFISTGGKVVKNVAGYDMTRLITGSAGTLGFITRATFRVTMIPECCMAVTVAGDLDTCAATAAAIVTSKHLPTFVVVTGSGNGTENLQQKNSDWHLHIGFEGFAETVRDQTARVAEQCEAGGLRKVGTQDFDVYDGQFGHLSHRLDRHAFILRADLPLANIAGFVKSANGRLTQSPLMLDLGCGRILSGLEHIDDNDWSQWCTRAKLSGGHVLLEKAPVEFKQRHDVFGLNRSDWKVMHRVKSELDPHRIFAPGRLPGKV
jgi:D-lactate dehydrogenase (cytochrome)